MMNVIILYSLLHTFADVQSADVNPWLHTHSADASISFATKPFPGAPERKLDADGKFALGKTFTSGGNAPLTFLSWRNWPWKVLLLFPFKPLDIPFTP